MVEYNNFLNETVPRSLKVNEQLISALLHRSLSTTDDNAGEILLVYGSAAPFHNIWHETLLYKIKENWIPDKWDDKKRKAHAAPPYGTISLSIVWLKPGHTYPQLYTRAE